MNQTASQLEGRTVRHRRRQRAQKGVVEMDYETNAPIAVKTALGRITYTTMESFEADWELLDESRVDHGPEIHGENAVSIAAIFERVLNPRHPEHSQGVRAAERFIEAERTRKRSMAPSPVPHYDPDEWDSYEQFLVFHNID